MVCMFTCVCLCLHVYVCLCVDVCTYACVHVCRPYIYIHNKCLLIVSRTGDADLSISTSTHTPCYGDVVTLVCHHPELASNPGRYFSTTPTWRENGVKITPISDTMFEAKTAVEPTHTNLTITITRDYFRNKSFNYSCRLVLAVNGLPGGVETSGEVTVDPVGVWLYCIYDVKSN